MVLLHKTQAPEGLRDYRMISLIHSAVGKMFAKVSGQHQRLGTGCSLGSGSYTSARNKIGRRRLTAASPDHREAEVLALIRDEGDSWIAAGYRTLAPLFAFRS